MQSASLNSDVPDWAITDAEGPADAQSECNRQEPLDPDNRVLTKHAEVCSSEEACPSGADNAVDPSNYIRSRLLFARGKLLGLQSWHHPFPPSRSNVSSQKRCRFLRAHQAINQEHSQVQLTLADKGKSTQPFRPRESWHSRWGWT